VRRPWRAELAAASGVLVLAALNYTLDLDATYFADEIGSIRAADGPLSGLIERVNATELVPPLYYALLSGWIELTGSVDETVVRAPSVVLGLVTVAAVGWLALRLGGPRIGLVAAALAALSPLLLTYAQQGRAYGLGIAAGTIAVAAAVEAARAAPRRWMALSAAAMVVGLWTHYTLVFVAAPLAVWVARGAVLRDRERVAYIATLAAAWLATLPFAFKQFEEGKITHRGGRLDLENLLQVVGAPFDSRANPYLLVAALGALVSVAACALALADRGRADARLIGACAALPVVAIVVSGLVGKDVVWSRYAAVAVPFVLVALALLARRASGAAVVGVAVALMLVHLERAHSREGEFADTRAAIAYVAGQWRPTDAVVLTVDATTNVSIDFYARRRLPAGALLAAPSPETLTRLTDEERRLWLFSAPVPARDLERALPAGARVSSIRRFPTGPVLQVALVEPR
jgi:hypothetical protein